MSSARDLLRLAARPAHLGAPVIVADPDFGESAVESGKAAERGGPARRSITRAPDLGMAYFGALRGTAREAHDVKALFPDASLLTRSGASKANLKGLVSPAILHIATHGFFLDHEARSPASAGSADPRGIRAGSGVENPLLRSASAADLGSPSLLFSGLASQRCHDKCRERRLDRHQRFLHAIVKLIATLIPHALRGTRSNQQQFGFLCFEFKFLNLLGRLTHRVGKLRPSYRLRLAVEEIASTPHRPIAFFDQGGIHAAAGGRVVR